MRICIFMFKFFFKNKLSFLSNSNLVQSHNKGIHNYTPYMCQTVKLCSVGPRIHILSGFQTEYNWSSDNPKLYQSTGKAQIILSPTPLCHPEQARLRLNLDRPFHLGWVRYLVLGPVQLSSPAATSHRSENVFLANTYQSGTYEYGSFLRVPCSLFFAF